MQNIFLNYSVTVTQSPTMMSFVSEGIGPAIVPFGTTMGRHGKGIVYRPLHKPQIQRRFGIVTLADRAMSPAALGLLEAIRTSWMSAPASDGSIGD